ncbi:hypothetical protein D3Z48_21235 [Clostridiaceae bacterium]|nr:hypothetical protein [Clostridiaceae bacterium]
MKFCKRLVSGTLLAATLAASMSSFAFAADHTTALPHTAAEPASESVVMPRTASAEITGNGVRLRKTPGLKGISLGQMDKGDLVTLWMEEPDYLVEADGMTWVHCYSHKIGKSGYVAAQYVDLENAG